MNNTFVVNGISWSVKYVNSTDEILRRPDNILTLGVTDFTTKTVYISRQLHGRLLNKVVLHELCHVVVFCYNIGWCKDREEELCDFIANYSEKIVAVGAHIIAELNGNQSNNKLSV